MPFVVDNKSLKRVKIKIGNEVYRMPTSCINGHFRVNLTIHDEQLRPFSKDGIVSFQAIDKKREFCGQVHQISPTGVSIISDIDDTVKMTNYLDKREFYKNTFLKEFRAVDGMVEVYNRWKKEYDNCCFHYVSASPYQLYEELDNFFQRAGFPPATYHLKTIRPKDKTVLQLFEDPLNYKRRQIEALLKRFPKRKFILVGDSGEKDPEVYCEIYQDYPAQISHIWIRNIDNSTPDRLQGVPPESWSFFIDGTDIKQ